MKYTYQIECPMLGKWNAFKQGSRHYCNGYMDAMRGQMPRSHLRLVRSDGKVMDEVLPHDDVGIGMVAGWPTAQQYEAAAERALKRARKIREHDSENTEIGQSESTGSDPIVQVSGFGVNNTYQTQCNFLLVGLTKSGKVVLSEGDGNWTDVSPRPDQNAEPSCDEARTKLTTPPCSRCEGLGWEWGYAHLVYGCEKKWHKCHCELGKTKPKPKGEPNE